MRQFSWADDQIGHLEIDSGRIEYACHGPAPTDAPTIIMLHEGLGSVGAWKEFPKVVQSKTGMGVLAYSRFGYGKSDKATLPRPLDYMTREALDVLPQVLNAINLQKAILLGHSDGATIAAIHAGSTEDYRIRGVILIAPHFFGEEMGLQGIKQAKEYYEKGDLKTRLAKYHDDPDNAFRGWNDAWLNPEFRDWNVSEVIDYLRVPVLAIQGRDDQYGTLAQIEEIESRIYSPFETVIFDDCGHAPQVEKSEETLAAIVEFTQRLNRIESEEVKTA